MAQYRHPPSPDSDQTREGDGGRIDFRKKGEKREKKMRDCGWKRSPSKFKLCFLLYFSIVQEAEKVLFLNVKPKFQSGWNGSSEKWGTGGAETDKFLMRNNVELQDILSLKNPKYPQKYPHPKNILVDVKTACWTNGPAGCFRE